MILADGDGGDDLIDRMAPHAGTRTVAAIPPAAPMARRRTRSAPRSAARTHGPGTSSTPVSASSRRQHGSASSISRSSIKPHTPPPVAATRRGGHAPRSRHREARDSDARGPVAVRSTHRRDRWRALPATRRGVTETASSDRESPGSARRTWAGAMHQPTRKPGRPKALDSVPKQSREADSGTGRGGRQSAALHRAVPEQ